MGLRLAGWRRLVPHQLIASCKMLNAAGDSVLLEPDCTHSYEFRSHIHHHKGPHVLHPWGALVFRDASVNGHRWRSLRRTQRCSGENMMNWTRATGRAGWGACVLSIKVQRPRRRRCVLQCQGARPGPSSIVQTLPASSPTERGTAGPVVPRASADSFTHHPLSCEIIDWVLLQIILNLELATIAEGDRKVGKCFIVITVSLSLGKFLTCLW